jgi:hypothetical protein
MLPQDEDGFAIPACDLLSDFLCEHQCDEDEGPPEEWPDWTDDDHWGITDQADLVLLRQLERTHWQDWLAAPAAEPLD